MYEAIDKLLDQYEGYLNFVVALFPEKYRPIVRQLMSPLYSQIDYFRKLNFGGGDPGRLLEVAATFDALSSSILVLRDDLTNDDETNPKLKAVNNSTVWQDYPADGVYRAAWINLRDNILKAADYTDSISLALTREAKVSRDYYSTLNNSIIGFGVSIGGLAAGIAAAPETMTASAWISLLLSTVSAIIGEVQLFRVENVKPTKIDNVCDSDFPYPIFGRVF